MDDKRLERIEDKVDKLNDHLSKIDVTLAAQHISLENHMRRTSLLETTVEVLKKHDNMIMGMITLITFIISIIAIIQHI